MDSDDKDNAEEKYFSLFVWPVVFKVLSLRGQEGLTRGL